MAISRRRFLQGTAVAAGAAAMPLGGSITAHGANEKIRVAVIGVRGRGRAHIDGLKDHLVALCDCDEQFLGIRAEGLGKSHGKEGEASFRKGIKVDTHKDFRELLDRKDIDAVSIATPNHSHALIAIAAIQAGKDVYVEKPVSHNVWEGRQIVNAARKYNRIVQCGTQSRSAKCLQQAREFVQSGKLGKIKYAIGTCYKPRKSIGKLAKPLEIPKTIDYDLWCGPAEKRDLYRSSLHYDWHWDFNTGNGDMGNQGIHQMDIARWFLGEEAMSRRILSIGGRLAYEDAGDTPNTQTVIHEFENAPLIFETRGLPINKAAQKRWRPMDKYRGSTIGVVVQCEQGYVLIPNSYSQVTAFDNDGNEIKKWTGGGNHFANFIDGVRSRNREELNGEILEGHISSAMCHTGSISHLLGAKTPAKEIAEQVKSDPLFSDSFNRMAAHLEANEIDIDSNAITFGASLAMDPETERFTNNDKANGMLRREDRKPFVVPDMST